MPQLICRVQNEGPFGPADEPAYPERHISSRFGTAVPGAGTRPRALHGGELAALWPFTDSCNGSWDPIPSVGAATLGDDFYLPF